MKLTTRFEKVSNMKGFIKKFATGLVATTVATLSFFTTFKQVQNHSAYVPNEATSVSSGSRSNVNSIQFEFGGEPAQAFWGSVAKEIAKAEGYDLAKWCLTNPGDCTKPAQDTAKNIQETWINPESVSNWVYWAYPNYPR